MKKLMIVLLLFLMTISACQADVNVLPEDGGIGIDIVPDNSSGEQQANQVPQQQEDAWWTNPIVIILLIVVVVLLVVLVVSQTRRPAS